MPRIPATIDNLGQPDLSLVLGRIGDDLAGLKGLVSSLVTAEAVRDAKVSEILALLESGGTPTPTPSPTLGVLTLAAASVQEGTAPGTVLSAILGKTAGSTLSIADSAGSRFAVSGTDLITGTVATDYETATSHVITIRETLVGATNTPRDTNFTISVTNALDGPALSALTFSDTSYTGGTAETGTIQGATAGSAITATGLPSGLTIDGPGRTFSWSGSGSAGTYTVQLTETLADSPNSPRTSPVSVTVVAAPASLPTGAFMTLLAEDATTPNVVRNRSEGPLPVSIWGPPRPSQHPLLNLFANAGTMAKGEIGTDGVAGALRMDWTAGNAPTFFLQGVATSQFPGGVYVPAGTWTLTYELTSMNGSAVTMNQGDQGNVIGQNNNLAVTTTPQEFSKTVTVASPGIARITFTAPAGAAGSVRVDKIRLVPGSVAGAADASPRHITRVGPFARSGQAIRTQPQGGNSVAGVEAHSYLSLGGAPAKRNALSFMFAVAMDNGVALDGNVYPLMSAAETPFASVGNTPFELSNLGGIFGLNGLPTGGGGLQTPVAGPDKSGWITIGLTAGTQGTTLYINRIRVASNSQPLDGPTLNALAFFGRNFSASFPGKAMGLGAWWKTLSAAEVQQGHSYLVQKIIDGGETFLEPAKQVIVEGDSITQSTDGKGGYVSKFARLFNIKPQIITYAIQGNGIADIEGRQTVVGAHMAEIQAAGKEPVLSVLIGANNTDMWGSNPSAYAARLEAYYDWAKSKGAKVVAHTLTAYNGLTATQQSNYAALNTMIRNMVTAGKADALADHAAGPMGTWSSTNFSDFVHPNPAGTDIMAVTVRDAMAPLLPDRS